MPLYFLFLNVGSDKGLEGLTKLRSLKDLLSDRKKNISHSLPSDAEKLAFFPMIGINKGSGVV